MKIVKNIVNYINLKNSKFYNKSENIGFYNYILIRNQNHSITTSGHIKSSICIFDYMPIVIDLRNLDREKLVNCLC